ncbi:hypothetical protein [Sulfurimonas sp.]|uniref:hypothetical protein n=1 Tax=Sulfurimonas sp. TaxID=2022749 RepID=UPI003D09D49B
MENLSAKTKKQIVLSRVIYEYITNGLGEALQTLSEQEMQLLAMRLNIQAITHAIELSKQEKITDFTYCFDQLGITFDTIVPLSQVEFTSTFIDEHLKTLHLELGDEFDDMVIYFQKMDTEVI